LAHRQKGESLRRFAADPHPGKVFSGIARRSFSATDKKLGE